MVLVGPRKWRTGFHVHICDECMWPSNATTTTMRLKCIYDTEKIHLIYVLLFLFAISIRCHLFSVYPASESGDGVWRSCPRLAARHRHKHFSPVCEFIFCLFFLLGQMCRCQRRTLAASRMCDYMCNFSEWTCVLCTTFDRNSIFAQQLTYSLQSTFIMCYENLQNYKKMNIMRFFNIIKFGLRARASAGAVCCMSRNVACTGAKNSIFTLGFFHFYFFLIFLSSPSLHPVRSLLCHTFFLWVLRERTNTPKFSRMLMPRAFYLCEKWHRGKNVITWYYHEQWFNTLCS